MNQRVTAIFDAARRLSPAEQTDLARQLLDAAVAADGPADEIEAEWIDEARRRLAAHEAVPGPTYDAFDTLDEIRARLARRRR